MTDRQREDIERRLTTWSRESEKSEDRWSAHLEEGNQRKADAARRRMIAMDGKIDAVLEILAIMGFAVTWVEDKAKIMEGK